MAQKKQIGCQQNPQVTNKSNMNQKDSFMREKHARGVLNYRHFHGKDYLEISISLNWSWKLSLKHDTEPLQCIPWQKQWKLRSLSTLAALLCVQQWGAQASEKLRCSPETQGSQVFILDMPLICFEQPTPSSCGYLSDRDCHNRRDLHTLARTMKLFREPDTIPALAWQRGLWGGAGSAFGRVCALLLTADPPGTCTASLCLLCAACTHSWHFPSPHLFQHMQGGIFFPLKLRKYVFLALRGACWQLNIVNID